MNDSPLSHDALKNNEILPQLIRVSDIDDTGRLRPLDSDAVTAIAASIAKDGLINPIDICQLPNQVSGLPYRLVAGGHRLGAFRLLGIEFILAFIRSNDALGRKSREIAENFFKAELSPLDKAAFVAELIETEKARMGIDSASDGRALNGRTKTKKELSEQLDSDLCIVHESLGIQEIVAQKLGLDRSTVSRQLALYRLPQALTERVRGMVIGQNAAALRALAKMEPARQVKVLDLIQSGKAKGVNDAVAIIDKRPVESKEDRLVQNMLGTFARMDKRTKNQALALLADALPKGWVLRKQGADDQGVEA